MREAKGHSLVHFFREGEERAGEEVELLEKGTIFQVLLLKRFQ